MLVLAPTTTRRGKVIYTEVDPALCSSKKNPSMTPIPSTMTVSASLEDAFQQDTFFMDDQEPHAPRITKVRF
jgi:hypothetical protein